MFKRDSINANYSWSLSSAARVPGTKPLTVELNERHYLRIRQVGEFAVVDIMNAKVLFEEAAVRELGEQLLVMVRTGRTRLALNFGRVGYASCALLSKLLCLHREVAKARGRLRLFGLDPVLKDAFRICHLDRVFDVYDTEAEALAADASGDGTT